MVQSHTKRFPRRHIHIVYKYRHAMAEGGTKHALPPLFEAAVDGVLEGIGSGTSTERHHVIVPVAWQTLQERTSDYNGLARTCSSNKQHVSPGSEQQQQHRFVH